MKLKTLFVPLFALAIASPALAAEKQGNLLGCEIVDLSDGKMAGQTYLELMKNTIKPTLDSFVDEGYEPASGQRLVEVLDLVDGKVRRQALRAIKGKNNNEKKANLIKLGDELAGQNVNLHTLPGLIGDTRLAQDRFKLSTYVGLASCAGVHTKYADDNYAYNIHYGTGAESRDERTGRSFGASRVSKANDASDAHYLKTLEAYVVNNKKNIKHFYTAILETLTNSQTRAYSKVVDQGDGVLTDFLAVFTAEQDRNLMDGDIHVHWDAALLQVTLLSAFHAGQEKMKVMYRDPRTRELLFTDSTFHPVWPKKDRVNNTCIRDWDSRRAKKAGLLDYYQLSMSNNPDHCSRSGLNITKKEWRLLSQEITSHLAESTEGQKLLEDVRRYLKGIRPGRKPDIFRELARFLIDNDSPAKVRGWSTLSKNMVKLLEHVRQEAPAITEKLEQKYNK